MQDYNADRPAARAAGGATGSEIFVEAWDHYAASAAQPRPRRRGRLARDLAQTFVLAVVIFMGTHTVVQGREVEGPSMQPNYHQGQRLFVNRAVYFHSPGWLSRLLPFVGDESGSHYLFHSPRRSEVVIFRPPFHSPDDLIKRVIGEPGDHVVVRDGRVTVNGHVLDEPYISGADTGCTGRYCDVVLGPGEFFVMGDNRNNSSDSRFFGPIKGDAIVGKAWLVVSPLRDFGFAP